MQHEGWLIVTADCLYALHSLTTERGGSLFLVINGSGTKRDLLLPRAIADHAFAAGFLPQNEIVWVKAMEVDGVIHTTCGGWSAEAAHDSIPSTVRQ